jgi:UDP-glucose 4-epimerase
LKVALGQKPEVEIFGNDYPTPDGTCIRDYIHIVDLAQAHMLALKCQRSDVFNLGSGDGYSVQQVVDTVRRVTGHKIPAVSRPRRPGDPPKLVGDSTKIRKLLGWKPQYDSLEAIVDSAWQWHRLHPEGYK